MSAQASLGNLPPSIRDLVVAASASATGANDSYLGRSEKEKSEVQEWTAKVSRGSFASEEGLKNLEADLLSRTFLVGNELTAADVAVFASLHPILSKRSPESYYAQPALTRYFDHLQHLPPVQAAAAAAKLELVTFDIDGMPTPQRAAPVKEKKPKAPASAEQPAAAVDTGVVISTPTPAPAASVTPAQEPATSKPTGGEKPAVDGKEVKTEKKKKEKKEPKEGAGPSAGKKGGAGAAAADDSGEPVPSMIDLRVGHILSVARHPDADSLYVEQIDVGEPEPRTVCSGLVNYIPIEEVRDRDVIVVCNLKPVTMRGVKSFAMLLCASSKDGKDAGIEFVNPPAGSKPGERVYFEGNKFEAAQPLPQLNPKKKIFETVQPGFTTLDTLEAAWVDKATGSVHRIRTKDGVCKAAKFVGASLS